MALLNRLFSTRKKNPKYTCAPNGKYEGESWRPFNFNREQVRVLLFRECDWRGRKLLFDSSLVKESSEKSCRSKLKFGGRHKLDAKYLSSISNGSCNQQSKPNTDVSMLGEMIFGSVGMTFKGSAFKVHRMKSSSQLMCSKVFLSPRCHRKHLSSERSLDDSCDSSLSFQGEQGVQRSSSDNRLTSRTGPLDVPWNDTFSNLYPPGSSYVQPSEEDSGFCGDTSLLSVNGSTSSGCGVSWGGAASWGSFGQPIGPPSSHGSGSLQSMQRRWLRSLHTSIELFCQNPSACVCCSGPANSVCFGGTASVEGLEENPEATSSVATLWGRRPKIGLAVVVTMDPLRQQQHFENNGLSEMEEEEQRLGQESFFFEHISVVEEMLDRLRLATEKACHSRKEVFIPLIMDACAELEQSLLDLFAGPRLSRPVWLGLLGQNGVGGLHHSTLALGFLEQLCQSLSTLDTKATNFFISTLVTAVLTHHLGWVHTVLPAALSRKQPSPNGYSLEGLSNSYPYNALWAQLGDLQGNLGYPPRLARTILMGKDTQVLNSLLFVLTYFLRCSRIECLHEDGPVESEDSPVTHIEMGATELKQEVSVAGVQEDSKGGNGFADSELTISTPQSVGSSTSTICHAGSDRLMPTARVAADGKGAPVKGLRRTRSHVASLGADVSSSGRSPLNLKSSELDVISEKVQKLCRVPMSAIEYHLNPAVSCENISSGASDSDVVFVLGEDEKLVGLKRRVPVVSSAGNVTAAEEVVELAESEKAGVMNRVGPGKVALGDQITALAGEFLNRCKEGIRLAGKAADSIGVVGGRTGLHGSNRKEIPKATCDIRSLDRVAVYVEDPLCSNGVHGNGRVGVVSGDNVLPQSLRRTLNKSSNAKGLSCEWTHVSARTGSYKEGSGDVTCVNGSVEWGGGVRTCECDVVEEFPEGDMWCDNSRLDPWKSAAELVEGMEDGFPLVDTSGLPSFEEIVTVELPMPKSVLRESRNEECKCGVGWGLASSLLGGTTDHYVPHMVLQGISCASSSSNATNWENRLRRDLFLSVQYPVHQSHPYMFQELSFSPFPVVAEPEVVEAVCVVGNVDKWEVQVVSSRSCLVDQPGTLGVRVGMSQLVANMLESLLILWRLRTPPEYCLLHLESKLREIWLRSHSLAQLLLTTEFCNMARVTTSLDLEANDVPLLLAVASTHTPQVTLRYGLSFR